MLIETASKSQLLWWRHRSLKMNCRFFPISPHWRSPSDIHKMMQHSVPRCSIWWYNMNGSNRLWTRLDMKKLWIDCLFSSKTVLIDQYLNGSNHSESDLIWRGCGSIVFFLLRLFLLINPSIRKSPYKGTPIGSHMHRLMCSQPYKMTHFCHILQPYFFF